MTAEATKQKAKTTPKFKPLGDRVLVRRFEAEETLKGGIILPETAKQKQEQAKVLALGSGKKDKDGKEIPFPVSIGDTILIEKYAGQEITLEDEEYIIIRSDDIIAVVE